MIADELKVGMFITVTEGKDKSWVGDILEVLAIDMPFISVSVKKRRLDCPISIDTRGKTFKKFSEEYLVSIMGDSYTPQEPQTPKQPAIPEGFRIATNKEREEFAYPTDRTVKWIFKNNPCDNAYYISIDDAGWKDEQDRLECNLLTFYIPTSYIFDEQITDEYLQNIDTPFGELPEKVRNALKERYNGKGGLDSNIERKEISGEFVKHTSDIDISFCLSDTLRLAKPDPKPRYVECDIVQQNGVYMVNFGAVKEEDKPRKHYNLVRLSKIIDHVGFAGVQFEGQKVDEWLMCINACIDKYGIIFSWMKEDREIATPIKARFLIK